MKRKIERVFASVMLLLLTQQRTVLGFTVPVVPSSLVNHHYHRMLPWENKNTLKHNLKSSRQYIPSSSSSSLKPLFMTPSPTSSNNALSNIGTTILTSVKVFDGSEITDTVVVSNTFTKMLLANIKTVIVGQFISVILFAIFVSITVNQLPKIGAVVSDLIFKEKDDGSGDLLGFVKVFIDEWVPQPSVTTINIQKLILSIIIDSIGSTSELVPIIGELTDILWAPIAAFALRYMYGSNVVFALEFMEEVLPLVDVLPLATFCWVVETFFGETEIARGLEIGRFQKGFVASGSGKKDNS